MSHRWRWGVSVVGLLLAVAGLSAPPATANHPAGPNTLECGTQVTGDYQLKHNVGPCVGDGLVVVASGTYNSATNTCTDYLVIDLNGYDIHGTLVSDGGAGIRMGDPADELNPSAFNGRHCVKVTDNSSSPSPTGSSPTMPTSEIYDFDACVAINAGHHNVVEEVHCHSNGDGFSPSIYGEGISISDSNNNEVTNLFVGTNNANVKLCDANDLPGDPPLPNTANGDGSPKDCGAIPGSAGPFGAVTVKGSSTNNNIHRNLIKNNNRCFTFGTGSCQNSGVRLEGDGVDSNTVEKNRIVGNGLDGVAFLIGPDSNTIKDNVVESNGFHHRTHRKGDGIRILGAAGADNNTITGNRVCANAAYGIRVDPGNTGNTVSGNNVGNLTTTDPINGGTLAACAANGILP